MKNKRHLVCIGHVGNPKLRLEDIDNQEVKKYVGTLSNPLYGNTTMAGIGNHSCTQDDTNLQLERSGSLHGENQLPGSYNHLHTQIVKFYKRWGTNYINTKQEDTF